MLFKLTDDITSGLRSHDEATKAGAARMLREQVESESRLLSAETFSKLMKELYHEIFVIVSSNDTELVRGGILIIRELVELEYEDNETRIIRFANFIRIIFQQPPDIVDDTTIALAATALGSLAFHGATLTADFLEFECKRAFEWLAAASHSTPIKENTKRSHFHFKSEDILQRRKLSAVLVLKELAKRCPVTFFSYVPTVFEYIQIVLHDDRTVTREAARECLGECLKLAMVRKSQLCVQWYYKVFDIAHFGFAKGGAPMIHGSLLTLGQLISHSGNFMIPRFREVCDTILNYRNHSSSLVRCTVITLIPQLAKFSPFTRWYLDSCIQILFDSVTKKSYERDCAFLSMGDMAAAVQHHILPHLVEIMLRVREGLVSDEVAHVEPIFKCISLLAQAVGPALLQHDMTHGLLREMFSCGLSQTLIDALSDLQKHIPSLRGLVTAHMLHSLSFTLANIPFVPPIGGGSWDDLDAVFDQMDIIEALALRPALMQEVSEVVPSKLVHETSTKLNDWLLLPFYDNVLDGPNWASSGCELIPKYRACCISSNAASNAKNSKSSERQETSSHRYGSRDKILLALRTLREFNFEHVNLLPFLHNRVMVYMDDINPEIRKEVAITFGFLLAKSQDEYVLSSWNETARLVSSSIERLVMLGVSDPDRSIRLAVLESLKENAQYDTFLIREGILTALFIALQDEDFMVRRIGMAIVSRLAPNNPAHIHPAIRKCILSAMSQLEFSPGGHPREEGAVILLGDIIAGFNRFSGHGTNQAPALIAPFIVSLIRILITKLHDAKSTRATAILRTLGEIASMEGIVMGEYMDSLIPLIIDILVDQGSPEKRQWALWTLGQVTRSSGHVIKPLLRYPGLFDALLAVINRASTKSWELREEALKALGTLGAVDPFMTKKSKQQNTMEKDLLAAPSSKLSLLVQDDNDDSGQPMGPSHDDYFPTVAISALLAILQDATLSTHHSMVVQALTHIFRSLGLSCVPFLPQVMPRILAVAASCELELRKVLFQNISVIVSISKQHIRPYLNDIFGIIHTYWYENLHQVLILLEELSQALREEFTPYARRVVPHILHMLSVLRDNDGGNKIVPLLQLGPGHRSEMLVKEDNQFHISSSKSNQSSINTGRLKDLPPPASLAPNSRMAVSGTSEGHQTNASSGHSMLVNFSDYAVISSSKRINNTIEILSFTLTDYFYLIIPALVDVVESESATRDVRRNTICTLGHMSIHADLSGYALNTMQCLLRLLRKPDHQNLKVQALDTICVFLLKFPPVFSMFRQMIDTCLVGQVIPDYVLERYKNTVKFIERDIEPTPDEVNRQVLYLLSNPACSYGTPLPNSSVVKLTVNPELDLNVSQKKLQVNQTKLNRAWDVTDKNTSDEWTEWARRLSVELLRESPSPALRACSAVAQMYNQLAKELFNAAFVSCWSVFTEQYSFSLIQSLKVALKSSNTPPETLQTLLNLAEFMEHDDRVLPIGIRDLGDYAQKCHAYAKALHYNEMVFRNLPGACTEALISINNELEQPEAAVGILHYTQELQRRQYQMSTLHPASEAIPEINMIDYGVAAATLSPHQQVLQSPQHQVRETQGGMFLDPSSSSFEQDLAEGKTIKLKATWFEKLGRWEEALLSYEEKLEDLDAPMSSKMELENVIGKVRCLINLGEYEQVMEMSVEMWPRVATQQAEEVMAPIFCQSAWALGDWDAMHGFVKHIPEQNLTGYMLRAVLALQLNDFDRARKMIDNGRNLLGEQLGALVGESYNRAYRQIVIVQQFAELDEIYTFKQQKMSGNYNELELELMKNKLQQMWATRIRGCQENVAVWQELLRCHSLILTDEEDMHTYIKFSTVCRKSGRLRICASVLQRLGMDDEVSQIDNVNPNVVFAFLKYKWSVFKGSNLRSRQESQLHFNVGGYTTNQRRTSSFSVVAVEQSGRLPYIGHLDNGIAKNPKYSRITLLKELDVLIKHLESMLDQHQLPHDDISLLVRCYLKYGRWTYSNGDYKLREDVIGQSLEAFKCATDIDVDNYKAWHAWALMNFRAVEYYNKSLIGAANNVANPGFSEKEIMTAKMNKYIVPAVRGFFQSISLGQSGDSRNVLQDILRLLTLWFGHGARKEVESAIEDGFEMVNIGTWLNVVPQLIARIHTQTPEIKDVLHRLLIAVGKEHPHALVYPLTVAAKSVNVLRQDAAKHILHELRRTEGNSDLVDQVQLVSNELIRVAILWNEEWMEALEDASKAHMQEKDTQAMLEILEPIHEKILDKYQTIYEREFSRMYGRELEAAYTHLQRWKETKQAVHIDQAWELYFAVFRKIQKELQQMKYLQLDQVSPALLRARNMQLAVPGTYVAGQPVVRIESFSSSIRVIVSKQRPRQITLKGSDGKDYLFLLKGHEDLRQDERVMQLFGLVNTLLLQERETNRYDLNIERFAVIPLSHNVGISEWLPNTDTFHALIQRFRKSRSVLLDIEQRLISKLVPDFTKLTVMQKVEAFCHALSHTTGQDLGKVLWLKSRNSEVWLDRRTSYTRSLATMSMVGYVLGLGDRHPSNLMLDRASGKVIHIDFGDCFEVAMNREKYPEKVPFRLTRMLIAAMEVSGVEGNFRYTCESVMRVLRANRDSVMAMLQAFVYDPLINWRLLAQDDNSNDNSGIDDKLSNIGEVNEDFSFEEDSEMSEPVSQSLHDFLPKRMITARQSENAMSTSASSPEGERSRAETESVLVHSRTDHDKAISETPNVGRTQRHNQMVQLRADSNSEVLNQRAIAVLQRVHGKLTGMDFAVPLLENKAVWRVDSDSETLEELSPASVSIQVQRLIVQATSHENLSQLYSGWCAVW